MGSPLLSIVRNLAKLKPVGYSLTLDKPFLSGDVRVDNCFVFLVFLVSHICFWLSEISDIIVI
jgi:hypothetical protein